MKKNQLLVHFYVTIWKFFVGEGLKNGLQGGEHTPVLPLCTCMHLKLQKELSKSQGKKLFNLQKPVWLYFPWMFDITTVFRSSFLKVKNHANIQIIRKNTLLFLLINSSCPTTFYLSTTALCLREPSSEELLLCKAYFLIGLEDYCSK